MIKVHSNDTCFLFQVEMGVPGPFIVVAPLSTIANWVKEFRNFAPEMPVILYHGNQVNNTSG